MKNVIKLLSYTVLLLLSCSTSAQYYTNQNKIWVFGTNAGLDFTSGSPVAINTSLNTSEGCASVSSADGVLLFYTDGKTVYNRLGAVMPAGGAVAPFNTNSTEQAALIIPVIGNSNQYYLMSLSFANSAVPNFCSMVYCIVDMTLDGGLGDVLSGTTNTSIEDSLSENMIAITGSNNNVWLVTHRRDTSLFLAYSISSSGIGTPIVSNTATHRAFGCYTWGMLKSSSNRRKIAQAIYRYSSCYDLEVFDFDPSTGVVSNPLIVDTISDAYGVEFSPDNSKLYALFHNGGKPRICQYDISLPTPAEVVASKYTFADTVGGGDLKLAPDRKIYFVSAGGKMGCINFPNLSGALAGCMRTALSLLPGTKAQSGLPNLYVTTDTSSFAGLPNPKYATNISLFPNPAFSKLNVSASDLLSNIVILNLYGQQMYIADCNASHTEIDISELPVGVYFVRINGDVVRRFVKH
jgi:hypothetical protein